LLIRSDDTFYEIKSKNTNHLWIIKKNLSSNHLIHLYHKHSVDMQYYHKQKSVNTVRFAIDMIKSHDDFVMKTKIL